MFSFDCCCAADNRPPVAAESTAALTPVPAGAVPGPLDDDPKTPKAGLQKETTAAKLQDDSSKEDTSALNDEFRISLSRERLSHSDLGLDMDSTDGKTLFVLKVREGPVKDWNARSNPNHKVRHTDRIIEVNGARGNSSRLIELIKAERDLLLITIKRSKEFAVDLDTNANGGTKSKIGLDIVHSASESLLIKRIKDGMVSEWNNANPTKIVKVGDRIVQVNNKRGDSHKILEVIANSDKLDLVISRTSLSPDLSNNH